MPHARRVQLAGGDVQLLGFLQPKAILGISWHKFIRCLAANAVCMPLGNSGNGLPTADLPPMQARLAFPCNFVRNTCQSSGEKMKNSTRTDTVLLFSMFLTPSCPSCSCLLLFVVTFDTFSQCMAMCISPTGFLMIFDVPKQDSCSMEGMRYGYKARKSSVCTGQCCSLV